MMPRRIVSLFAAVVVAGVCTTNLALAVYIREAREGAVTSLGVALISLAIRVRRRSVGVRMIYWRADPLLLGVATLIALTQAQPATVVALAALSWFAVALAFYAAHRPPRLASADQPTPSTEGVARSLLLKAAVVGFFLALVAPVLGQAAVISSSVATGVLVAEFLLAMASLLVLALSRPNKDGSNGG